MPKHTSFRVCIVLSYLQLGDGETTSSAKTTVVFDGWASDSGSQFIDWARRDSCSL